MPKRSPSQGQEPQDYRHEDTRPNIPEAGMAGLATVPKPAPKRYQYDPHLDPMRGSVKVTTVFAPKWPRDRPKWPENRVKRRRAPCQFS